MIARRQPPSGTAQAPHCCLYHDCWNLSWKFATSGIAPVASPLSSPPWAAGICRSMITRTEKQTSEAALVALHCFLPENCWSLSLPVHMDDQTPSRTASVAPPLFSAENCWNLSLHDHKDTRPPSRTPLVAALSRRGLLELVMQVCRDVVATAVDNCTCGTPRGLQELVVAR